MERIGKVTFTEGDNVITPVSYRLKHVCLDTSIAMLDYRFVQVSLSPDKVAHSANNFSCPYWC